MNKGNLSAEEQKWLEIGKQISQIQLRDFPQRDKSYIDITRRGDTILLNTLRGIMHIQRNLGDELSKDTIFEKLEDLCSTLTGVTAYGIGERVAELERQQLKRQTAKEHVTRSKRKKIEKQQQQKQEEEESIECEPSSSIELINVVKEEPIEQQFYRKEQRTPEEQDNLITKILRYPRVIFCWGDFVRDCPLITQEELSHKYEALMTLQNCGLVSKLDGSDNKPLKLDTVFIKETRETSCNEIYEFGMTFDEYLRIHFITPSIHRRPLFEQILCFDRAITITYDTRNQPQLENIMSLAIIQIDSAIITPGTIKISNLKLIDNVFNRMQYFGLLKAFNTSYSDPAQWEFKKQLCGEDLNQRLKHYGLDSSYFYDAGIEEALMMRQTLEEDDQDDVDDNGDFIENEIKIEIKPLV